MAATLNATLLDRLDALAHSYELHCGPVDEPVNIWPALEKFTTAYLALPDPVRAMTLRWQRAGHRYVDITYNTGLREPERSAEKRYAAAHEFAHIFCRHRGDLFIMGRRHESSSFERFVDDIQERQCEYVAAYLLVPMAALYAMRGQSTADIAVVLDVPVHLVEVRWAIWRRLSR